MAEVLSPGNEDADRGPKREAYGLMGVEWMWILDPAERTVEAFENVCGTMVAGRRLGAEDILALPPFEALTLRVEALFAL